MNLNEIDIKKLHLQSKFVQLICALVVVVLLVFVGYLVMFQDQWTEYHDAVAKEAKLKTDYQEKSAKAASLDNLKQELVLIESSINVLLKQLPTSSEIPNLIQELHQAAAKNGLTLSSVVPQQVVVENPIERLPFAITVNGNYEQIAQFTRDIGKMSRIVTLSNISLDGDGKQTKSEGKLMFSALANTYKALDTEISSASSVQSEDSNADNR